MWETRGEVNAIPALAIHDEIIEETPVLQAQETESRLIRCIEEGRKQVLKQVPVVVESEVKETWRAGF